MSHNSTKKKHYKIKYHFVREVEQLKEVKLVHCSSEYQLTNILTKPLGIDRFKRLRNTIGVYCIEANEECYKLANNAANETCCMLTLFE